MPPTAEHPFLEGKRYRDDELGEMAVQKANWRYMAFGVLGLLALSILGNIYLGSLPKMVPAYVEVDTMTGGMRVVGPAPQEYDLRESTVKKELREFVEVLRRISTDVPLMQLHWTRLFHHVTPRGHKLLAAYATERNPLAQKDPVAVEVLRVLRQSEFTWDVRWQETTYSAKGEQKSSATYSGLFTWERQLPTTLDALTMNPSGILLDSWSWSKE
jgi:type IV secretory pathway TrbF-like protein